MPEHTHTLSCYVNLASRRMEISLYAIIATFSFPKNQGISALDFQVNTYIEKEREIKRDIDIIKKKKKSPAGLEETGRD